MPDEDNSVMIALLPTTSEWSKLKLPHMTLVYAGVLGESVQDEDLERMVKDASYLAQLTSPFGLKVTGVETFGKDDEMVDVLVLELTTWLRAMRHFVVHWNASEYKEFRPHCSIGGSPGQGQLQDNPMWLMFDRIAVCWGEQIIPFWLKGAM